MKDDLRRLRVLFRHFFSRMFSSDLLKFEDQQRESQVVTLVLLAIAGMLAASFAYEPFLLFGMSGLRPADLWQYESMLVTFSMAVAGVIAVASWDNLFLDRLDRVNLCSLPVSRGVLFAGKSFGLLAFVVAVTLIGNFFPILMASGYTSSLLGSIAAGPAHFAAVLAGSLFVFLAVALLQVLFTASLPPRISRRVAILAQTVLLLVFLSPFVWFPMLFRSLPALKMQGSALFTFFPPLWFTGVFDHFIGHADPLLDRAARIGLAAVALLLLGYLLISLVSLRKFLSAADTSPTTGRGRRHSSSGGRTLAALFLRHPIERAVFSFVLLTLRRSREHKLKLTLFLALPVSLLLSRFAYLYLKSGLAAGTLDSLLLSMPLTLHFFLIGGMRLTVGTPHILPANFIFCVSGQGPLRLYMSGVRKALFCGAILPPLLISLPFLLYFWGVRLALAHSLFALAVALLLLEACFFGYRRLPFACEHLPGGFKLRYYWPFMLVGYYVYLGALAGLARRLLAAPSAYPVFFVFMSLLYVLLRIQQRRRLAGERLVFEVEPEAAMQTLGLD